MASVGNVVCLFVCLRLFWGGLLGGGLPVCKSRENLDRLEVSWLFEALLIPNKCTSKLILIA